MHEGVQVVRDAIRAIAEVAEVHRGERMNGKNGLALLSGPGALPLHALHYVRAHALILLPQVLSDGKRNQFCWVLFMDF